MYPSSTHQIDTIIFMPNIDEHHQLCTEHPCLVVSLALCLVLCCCCVVFLIKILQALRVMILGTKWSSIYLTIALFCINIKIIKNVIPYNAYNPWHHNKIHMMISAIVVLILQSCVVKINLLSVIKRFSKCLTCTNKNTIQHCMVMN